MNHYHNVGGVVPLPNNAVINKGYELVDQAYNNKCGSEPIILIGYSRGGASVQQLAGLFNLRGPGMRIDMVVTIAPVDILHQNAPVSKSKLPNVAMHLNFRSGQGVAAQFPIGKDVNDVYPEPFPSLLASEFSVQGADGDVVVQKTSHFTILRNPMSRFEYRKPPPGSTGMYYANPDYVDEPWRYYVKVDSISNWMWQMVDSAITVALAAHAKYNS